jgi:hypothetical protein
VRPPLPGMLKKEAALFENLEGLSRNCGLACACCLEYCSHSIGRNIFQAEMYAININKYYRICLNLDRIESGHFQLKFSS